MATLRRDISLDAPADQVWSAVSDFGQVHVRVAPGFLTALEMDPKSNGGDRIVTFFNGILLPDELAPAIGGMMDQATGVMKKTLEAA
jgi:hypothetical protein